MTPERIIELLDMQPHPEGGHYVETWRHVPEEGGRGHGPGFELAAKAE